MLSVAISEKDMCLFICISLCYFISKILMLLNDIQESRSHVQQLYKSMGADKVCCSYTIYFIEFLDVIHWKE